MTFLVLVLLLVAITEYILHNAEPILCRRLTATLAARFDAPVTLDGLSISLFRGLEVTGDGLQIGYSAGTDPAPGKGLPAQPMIAVAHFRFRTGLRALVGDTLAHRPLHIGLVRIRGLDLRIPPPHDRNDADRAGRPHVPEKYAVVVDQLECRDVRLFLQSAQPGNGIGGKPPLQFNIRTLDLENVGRHRAMRYDAELSLPKPAGALHAVGHFGPWAGETIDTPPGGPLPQPGNTPVDGDYTFDHANLATIKGIAGTLSSTGHFAGTLRRLAIDGHTDTPDFALNLTRHPTPLHTDFHAFVDGTNGDIYLQPVHALLGTPQAGSAFTVSGKIVKLRGGGSGHDIQLTVDIPHGRMEDFLRLAIRTSPPLLTGTLALHATLHIPPGAAPVPEKLAMAGNFTVTGVQFTNPRWQSRLNGLSARATGHPEDGSFATTAQQSLARSQLAADFTLDQGVLGITGLRFALPGAQALMNGVYSTDGKLFEFKGHVRTEATASQMVGGWKGLLLSPLDHYLQKNGAGVELPVEISGTQGDLHFGLATDGANDSPARLLTDVRAKAHAKQELAQGRDLFAEARGEDEAAARAPTLEEAQRHHDAAVRLRAEAQHLAQNATGSRQN